MARTMTVDELEKNFRAVTARIKSRKTGAFKITETTANKKQSPVMAIISWDEYQGLLETLEILQDKEFMQSLSQSMKDEKAGRGIPWKEAKKKLAW